MNAWAFFVHRVPAAEDTQPAGSLFGNPRQAQDENVDAHLKGFCATAFWSRGRTGGLLRHASFYQEKNDEGVLDSYTSVLT